MMISETFSEDKDLIVTIQDSTDKDANPNPTIEFDPKYTIVCKDQIYGSIVI